MNGLRLASRQWLRFPGFTVVAVLNLATGFWPDTAAGQEVVINELVAINDQGLADADGDFPDWLELHNPGANPVSLLDWALTDDPARLRQWLFPAVTLPPNGFLVVFASGKDRRVAGAQLHTNFKLDGDGEFLALVKPDGVTVASQFAPRFPNQRKNVSYGFGADAGLHYLRPPTPGAANGTNYVQFVADT